MRRPKITSKCERLVPKREILWRIGRTSKATNQLYTLEIARDRKVKILPPLLSRNRTSVLISARKFRGWIYRKDQEQWQIGHNQMVQMYRHLKVGTPKKPCPLTICCPANLQWCALQNKYSNIKISKYPLTKHHVRLHVPWCQQDPSTNPKTGNSEAHYLSPRASLAWFTEQVCGGLRFESLFPLFSYAISLCQVG